MHRWKSVSTNTATLLARLSATAAIFIVNGFAYRHMTPEEYGLWIMLYSINLLTNGLDMGFQFTLGNRMAALFSQGPEKEQDRRDTFLSVCLLQGLFFLADSLLVLLIVPHLPWVRWLKITDPQLGALTMRLIAPVLVLMIGTLPLNLISTVFFAYGEIQLSSFLTLLSNCSQTAVFIAAALYGNFTGMVIAYFGMNIAFGIGTTIFLFIHRRWAFVIPPPGRMLGIIRSLARVSFHSFFHTISAIIATILGPILSGAVSGLVAAGEFANIQKMFSFLLTAHLALMAPVAPEITANSHSGNWEVVRARLRLYVFRIWPLVFVLGGAMVWLCHPFLLRLWLGRPIELYRLAGLLFAWACLAGFVNTFSVFLNSLGLMKFQAIFSLAMVLPGILIPSLLGRWYGPQGIALGFILCSIPAVIIWPIYTYDAIRRQKSRF